MNLTISSTAFPKVAFRRPPSVSPRCTASSSVTNERIPARGMMARKLSENTAVGPQWSEEAAKPTGIKSSRGFRLSGTGC